MRNVPYIALFAALPAIMALHWSCNRADAPDCLQHAGAYTTEHRALEPFSQIELHDFIQIELCDSAGYASAVHAPENLVPEIITTVENGKLVVENANSCNWVRSFNKPITVRICAPEFPDIQNFGTGDMRSVNTLVCDVIKLENRHAAGIIQLDVAVDSCIFSVHTGVCDLVVSGQCRRGDLFNQGMGTMDASDLACEQAYINNSSINDIRARASGYLFAYIAFDGDVYYAGNPGLIDSVIEGGGNLIALP